jgi:hypothetical protein
VDDLTLIAPMWFQVQIYISNPPFGRIGGHLLFFTEGLLFSAATLRAGNRARGVPHEAGVGPQRPRREAEGEGPRHGVAAEREG